MPLISVIIPTYNREAFVGEAIDSVLRQRFMDREIVVVDDGSTDSTRRTLERYGNKIRCIVQENLGVSAARNAGILAAQGMWVAFLDSDDEWEEDYLETQVANVRDFPDAVAHMTNAVTVSSAGKSNYFDEIGLLRKFGSKDRLNLAKPLGVVIQYAVTLMQTAIIRRDILLATGLFDTTLSIAEDVDLIARVSLRGAFSICRRDLVRVIRREESIRHLGAQSLEGGTYRYESFSKVYSQLLRCGSLGWMERVILLRAFSHSQRALGNALVLAGRRVEARHAYRSSCVHYPSVRSIVKYAGTFLPEPVSRVLVRRVRKVLPEGHSK